MKNAEAEDNANKRIIKHDIRNQLSNVVLALEQLRYEMENPSTDAVICFDIISSSCTHINSLIDDL